MFSNFACMVLSSQTDGVVLKKIKSANTNLIDKDNNNVLEAVDKKAIKTFNLVMRNSYLEKVANYECTKSIVLCITIILIICVAAFLKEIEL